MILSKLTLYKVADKSRKNKNSEAAIDDYDDNLSSSSFDPDGKYITDDYYDDESDDTSFDDEDKNDNDDFDDDYDSICAPPNAINSTST